MRREPCLTGACVEAQRRLVRERWGDEVLRKALSALPLDQAEEVRSAHPLQWVRVRAVAAFFDALSRELDETVDDVHRLVSRGDRRQREPFRRILLRITSTDRQLLGRARARFRRSYDTGSVITRLLEPGLGELSLRGWPDVPEFTLRGLRLDMGEVLEAAGRRPVQLRTEPTEDGADLTASWTSPRLLPG